MLKKLKISSMILIMAIILIGCHESTTEPPAQTDTQSKEQVVEQEETVVITISKDEGEEVITTKEIPIQEGDLLMDVMKEHFTIEEENGFITSIEGIAPAEDEKKAWMYFVNGEMAMVGAAEYELSAGDEVTFDLQSWE